MDPDRPALPKQLSDVIAELSQVSDRVRAFDKRVSSDQWLRRAAPDRWSAVECVQHLNLTSQAFVSLFRQALRLAAEQGLTGRGPYHLDVAGWLLVRALRSESHFFRSRATEPFVPRDVPSSEIALREFLGLQNSLIACVNEANGRPVDKIKIGSPFNSRLRYSLYSAFRIIPFHQIRHLRQAELAAGAPT